MSYLSNVILLADISNPLTPRLNPTDAKEPVGIFSSALAVIISTFFVVGTVLFVIYFMLGAYTWITSSGDAKAVEKARNSVTHALIGLVVLLALFAILRLLQDVFGVQLLNIDVGKIRLK